MAIVYFVVFSQSERCRLAHLSPKELVKHHEDAEVSAATDCSVCVPTQCAVY